LTSSSKCSIILINNFTSERAKLSKGSDAKPRVKSAKGHDSRAAEGTRKRLHTIGYQGVFYFQKFYGKRGIPSVADNPKRGAYVKRIFLLFICCLPFFGIVLPVSAFELGIRGNYWFPKLSGEVRADNAGVVGTELDLKDDLHMDSNSYPVIEVFSGIGKHHLSLAFYHLDYDGDTVLTKDINFNGELFHANERVISNLKYDNYDVIYRYDLIDLENLLAGGSLGLVARMTVFDGSASIASAAVTTRENFTAPIPMVGANFHVGLLKDLIELRVLVSGVEYRDNTAFDGQAEISLTPFPFLDIHGGYRFLKIDVDQDDVKLDFDNSGLYVALTLSF
jgi:hypothetical protein